VEYNARFSEIALRYLIFSDIHSNFEAFTRCREMADGKYDEALCLGDLVGYGPDPNAVVTGVREIASRIIRGNHDKACCGITDAEDFNALARQATLWTRGELTPENLAFLRTLPSGPVFMDSFQMVHGSPGDEDEYIFGPGQALPTLRNLALQIVLFGHTHFQGGFMITPNGRYQSIRCASTEDGLTFTLPLEDGARYLINPGSAGQPRDGDWRAAFAILDEEKHEVEYYRTPYDLPATQEKMRKAGLPEPLIRRLELGR
jgi:predicted phosphodiesterase